MAISWEQAAFALMCAAGLGFVPGTLWGVWLHRTGRWGRPGPSFVHQHDDERSR